MFQAATSDCVCPIVSAFLSQNRMRTPFGCLGLLLLFVFVDPKALWAVEFDVIVEGAGFSRSHSVASFECPQSIWDPELDQGGSVLPVQFGLDGRLHFLVESLDAGETRRFRLRNRTGAPKSHKGIWVERKGDNFRFELNGEPLVQYLSLIHISEPTRPY